MKRALLLLSLAACSAERAPQPGPGSLTIDNQSQYVLDEVRRHETPAYTDAPNMLSAPLAINSTVAFSAEGSWYVTVIREKNRGGEKLAFSTLNPVQMLARTGKRLLVFDDSFRVITDEYISPK